MNVGAGFIDNLGEYGVIKNLQIGLENTGTSYKFDVVFIESDNVHYFSKSIAMGAIVRISSGKINE